MNEVRHFDILVLFLPTPQSPFLHLLVDYCPFFYVKMISHHEKLETFFNNNNTSRTIHVRKVLVRLNHSHTCFTLHYITTHKKCYQRSCDTANTIQNKSAIFINSDSSLFIYDFPSDFNRLNLIFIVNQPL